jgi:hypothetical protein
MNPGQIVRHATQVLEIEAPVSLDEVVLRIRSAFGLDRSGSRIHELVTKAVRIALAKSPFKLSEGFYVNSTRTVVPRKREGNIPASLRNSDNLPPQEIRAAILVVIESHLGVQRDEIPGAVARLFGFKATSQQIRITIEAQVQKLLRGGIVVVTNGLVQRASNANRSTPLS